MRTAFSARMSSILRLSSSQSSAKTISAPRRTEDAKKSWPNILKGLAAMGLLVRNANSSTMVLEPKAVLTR